MDRSMFESLRDMRFGVLLALLGVLFGFGMGGVFGVAEASLKEGLRSNAAAVLATKYGSDEAKAKEVVDKAWSYYKRAHMHGGGIGAAALAVMLVLAAAGAHASTSRLAALGLGIGALGYPLYWLWAGARAPGLGGTGLAKDSLEWLAIPTSGAALVGLILAIGAASAALFRGTR